MSTLTFRELDDVRAHVDALPGPVTLTLFRHSMACDDCETAEAMVRDLAMASHLFRFEVLLWSEQPPVASADRIDLVPALMVNGIAGGRVRFFGVPTTNQFSAFLKAMKEAAQGKLDLFPATRHRLSNLRRRLHLRLLVPRTMHACPSIGIMAQKLAFAHDHVTTDIVNVKAFKDIEKHFGAQTEPKLLVNDVAVAFDARSEAHFAESLLRSIT